MRTHTNLLFLAALFCAGLLPKSAWSCLNDSQWQDTLRCQFYPTSRQTPPPAPTPPTHVDQIADFTRVDLPVRDASNQILRCVDGTRPVIYVDRAEGEVESDKWLITFQGGGSCNNGQSCLDAYLSPSEESEMGSALQPAMKNMAGIHSTRSDNDFREYNRVRIHKCGYDRYNGTAIVSNASGMADIDWNRNGVPSETINSPAAQNFDQSVKSVREGNVHSFELYHQGKQHVRHALDQLLGGLKYNTWVDDRGDVHSVMASLPAMKNAKTILFAGHSGAAHGLMHSVDSLVDYMSTWSQQHGTVFDADVRAMFDAQLLPSVESEAAFIDRLPFDVYDHSSECESDCESGPPLRYTYNAATYFSSGGLGGPGFFDGPYQEWNTELDASCLLAHPAEEWRCVDRFHVLFNHITTPFFIREDFRDPNGQHNNNPPGPENQGHRLFWANAELRHCSDPYALVPCLPTLSQADFRVRVEEQAERLKEDFSIRSELALNQLPVPTVYLWLPDCASHAGAFDSAQFFNVTMKSDLLLKDSTMHDFLMQFMSSSPIAGFDSRIDGDGDWRSVCG